MVEASDPVTTLDQLNRPLRDLRVSVTDRCNFRCPYCMPAEQYPERHPFAEPTQLLQFDEIERLVGIFTGLGVSKLRLTGGEPLLRKNLPTLIDSLSVIAGIDDLAMTTNGVLLPRHAKALRQAGLRRLTVSVDAIDADTFSRMSGDRGSIDEVLAGIAAAREAGFGNIKINAVVRRQQNFDRVLELVEYFRNQHTTLRFIEYMDVGTLNNWQENEVVTTAELQDLIGARWPIEPVAASYRGEVAQRYRYLDGAGEIGFISSISAPFCQDCTRARLSADGSLYTCLFGREGTDLKTPLRAGATDAELLELITGVWNRRSDRYSEQRAEQRAAQHAAGQGLKIRVEMFKVGG